MSRRKKTRKVIPETEKKKDPIKVTYSQPKFNIPSPRLRFSAYAYAKMVFMRDMSNNEVGGFGITYPEDPLLVEDFILVPQEVSSASVEFDDTGVADFVERMMEFNIPPAQCMRIWIHTHPGSMNSPSTTDEVTFFNVFSKCDWAIMFILAQNDKTFCALQHNTIPACRINIETGVDFSAPFIGSNQEEWLTEYTTMVKECKILAPASYPIKRRGESKEDEARRAAILEKYDDEFGKLDCIGEIVDEEWLLGRGYGGHYGSL